MRKHLLLVICLFFGINFSLSSQVGISCEQTIDNSIGTNNLENYPIRPVGLFRGPEVIIPINVLPGALEVCVTTSNRVRIDAGPGNNFGDVDAFVLTDPTDASSAILWVNGIGSTSCFNPVAGQDYYLVLDGFRGSLAILDITISGASCNTTPIPTMSQWGILIFGLLVLNLGLYFIRREERVLGF